MPQPKSPAVSKHPTHRRRPRSRGRLPVIPIAVGIVALLAIVAVVATAGDNGVDKGSTGADLRQSRPVTTTGVPLVPLDEGADAAVGAPAPVVIGARFDGSTVRIEPDGRPKVLVFLAHWCPHCQREVPVLADWIADNGPPGDVDIYGIATGTTSDRPNFPPSEWLERERFTPPTLADDANGTAGRAFGLSAFPFFVAIDADNHVVARTSGELTVPQWEALLERAVAGRR